MKKFVLVTLVILVIGIAWRYVSLGADIVTGYSAKQLCSGVFVAGLPESFVRERDINPRMARFLGPVLAQLHLSIDENSGSVESDFLGFSSVAIYTPKVGCTLNSQLREKGVAAASVRAKPKVSVDELERVEPPVEYQPAFEKAFEEPKGGGRNTLAIVVMHKGRIIAERYLAPVTADTPMQGWSMNKSLMATWVGMQVKKGHMSLDLPVLEALQSRGVALGDIEEKIDPDLTLFNLLHMESGFDFKETYLPGDDATNMLYRSPAMWKVAPSTGHKFPPGEHFSYSSGDTNLVSYLWQGSLQGEPYNQWLSTHFSGPLGLRSIVSEADASGVQVASSYTYMSPHDWLRVGQFWLDAWHNRTELLPRNWQREAVQSSSSDSNGIYGLAFWINTQGKIFPSLPKNIFYAGGNSGQRVLIIPDEELVIVRLGLTEPGVNQGVETFARSIMDLVDGPQEL